jgi:hypothetical protein
MNVVELSWRDVHLGCRCGRPCTPEVRNSYSVSGLSRVQLYKKDRQLFEIGPGSKWSVS